MKLRDRELLNAYIKKADWPKARVARHAGVSRQFVHMLTTGERTTCTERVGRLIEEALDLLPGTLFVRQTSPVKGPHVPSRKTAA